MSRVGSAPIKVPAGVIVEVVDSSVTVSGSSGTRIVRSIPNGLKCVLGEGVISVSTVDDLKKIGRSRVVGSIRSSWGLFRKTLSNCIVGMHTGFLVVLDITGVGYKAFVSPDGKSISLNLGYSHDLVVPVPEGVTAKCEKNVTLELRGPDNVILGDFAARLSSFRVPDPYKLKGIIRRGRFIRKKEGKAG